jgi:hypothetical protein
MCSSIKKDIRSKILPKLKLNVDSVLGALYQTGENLKAVWAEFINNRLGYIGR